jgi:hypothetical protein
MKYPIEWRLARFLMRQKSLHIALRALSQIFDSWLNSVQETALRSYLIAATKKDPTEKPKEWQSEFRVGLHIDKVSSEILRQLVDSRYSSEVTYRYWQISIKDSGFDPPRLDLLDVEKTKDPEDDAQEILATLKDKQISEAMRLIVEGTILWLYNFDLGLIKEDAIQEGHYDDGMDEAAIRSHVLRSFYMFFTGA